MTFICTMSPILKYDGRRVSILFQCPKGCEAINYVGMNTCIASHVLVVASCLNFSNVERMSSIFLKSWDIDLKYVLSLAELVRYLRIENFRIFNALYNALLSEGDEIVFNAFSKCFLLNPCIGHVFYDLRGVSETFPLLSGYEKILRHKLLKKFLRKMKHELNKVSLVDKTVSNDVYGRSPFLSDVSCGEKIFIKEVDDSSHLCEPLYVIRHSFRYVSCIPALWAVSVLLRFKSYKKFPRIGHGYISSLLSIRFSLAKKIVRKLFPEFSRGIVNQIALSATFDSLGFYKLYLFFLDDDIEELFMDAPNTSLYLDHSRLGRCRTNVVLSRFDVERIITQLKAESGLNLDITSPSIKTDLITSLFRLRVSVDIPPLTVDGPSLIFRRFRQKPLTIVDLVKNKTITSEAAAYLVFCLFNRRNILAIGEPASGKTTLINALDIITPQHWRKLSIESIVESVRQAFLNKHQVRFRVDPLERRSSKRRKIYEVTKLLHRSPNYIFLGEILTNEHTRALFNALASGLRGFQTCHASSPEALLTRWVIHHSIPVPCLADLDVIVLMKHILEFRFNRRYVHRISELFLDKNTFTLDGIKIVDVFRRETFYDELKPVIDLYESPVIWKIRRERKLDRNALYSELSFYSEVIDSLCKMRGCTPEKISSILAQAYVFARNGFFDVRRFMVEVDVEGLQGL